MEGRTTHRLRWAFQLYDGLFNGSINHGDRVILDSFFVTEWIPRVPGGLALALLQKQASIDNYLEAQKRESIIRLPLSQSIHLPLVGSTVLPLPGDTKQNIALGAVSAEEYCTDLGIVLSVSAPVYGQFKKRQFNNNAVEATLEGFVDQNPKGEFIAPVPPSAKDDTVVSEFAKMWSKPPCAILVDSPLQVSFKTHNSHPKVTSWMIRRLQHAFVERDKYEKGISSGRKGGFVEYDFVANTLDEASIKEILKHHNAYATREFPGEELSSDSEYKKIGASGLKRFLMKELTPFTDVLVHVEALTDFYGIHRFPDTVFPMRIDDSKKDESNRLDQYLKEIITKEEQSEKKQQTSLTTTSSKRGKLHR
jgi:hypothetical protein